jgi:hypothetical protein
LKRKFTVKFEQSRAQWILKHDDTEKIIKTFKGKEEAGRAGVLRKVLGRKGGTVVLRTKTGAFDEERNFPELQD